MNKIQKKWKVKAIHLKLKKEEIDRVFENDNQAELYNIALDNSDKYSLGDLMYVKSKLIAKEKEYNSEKLTHRAP